MMDGAIESTQTQEARVNPFVVMNDDQINYKGKHSGSKNCDESLKIEKMNEIHSD